MNKKLTLVRVSEREPRLPLCGLMFHVYGLSIVTAGVDYIGRTRLTRTNSRIVSHISCTPRPLSFFL